MRRGYFRVLILLVCVSDFLKRTEEEKGDDGDYRRELDGQNAAEAVKI